MLADLVVDANIWAHTQNPNSAWYEDSLDFCERLLISQTIVVVDAGGLIEQEYEENLTPASVGYQTLASLAASGRLAHMPAAVPANIRRTIEALIPRNSRDRTYVRISYNSTGRHLGSHDWDDFNDDVRADLYERIQVLVLEAHELTPLL
jgi:hypothetical protein